MSQLLRFIRAAMPDGATDRNLLDRFARSRDEEAFALIVQRYAPGVWAACRRLAGQDAEDAFQTVFLTLVRKAASVNGSLPAWLHEVVRRVAANLRRSASRRAVVEATAARHEDTRPDDLTLREGLALLDEELARLPEQYRAVLIVCCLEGRSRDEAATQLGWSDGQVKGRLERAREMLRQRFGRRGIELGGVLLAATLPGQASSAPVVPSAAILSAGHAVSPVVVFLTNGVVHAMQIQKIKVLAAVLLMTACAGALTYRSVMGSTATTESRGSKPNVAEGDKENALTVTIKPQKDPIRVQDAFKVNMRVVNSSKAAQTFEVMSCSWDEHWKSSNQRISWEGWECGKNTRVTVSLDPGEAYEQTLPMLLAAGKPQEKVSFKMGFTPIDSKQTFWSDEATVLVEDKKEPKFMPIARYPSEDQAAEKRIKELLDAAKITFISVGSRGLTASVTEDKAKQARAILEKAVKDGTLSVTVLDQLPVPKNLRAVRTDDKLRIEEDTASNEEVVVPVAAGLIRSTEYEMSMYRGKERVSHTGGTYTPPIEFTPAASKIPNPGESYEVELIVKWFETDAPIQPNWKPQSGGKYKVLVTRTLKLSVGAENTKPAPVPPSRWEKLLQEKDLTAKQRAAYEQIAKLQAVKLDRHDWGTISIPSRIENSKLPTDALYAMGLDALPMLAEALDDETPTATVITQEKGSIKKVKEWKVNEIAALLIVRISDRDFVIGEFPKELVIRDIAQRPKAAPEFRKMVVEWHGKFATKTPIERKIADVTDPWFRNRFDAIVWLGGTKATEGRAPIVAWVDKFYDDKNREYSSLRRAEMSHCSLALGQIGDKVDLPAVRKVCKDMSYWLETYGISGSAMLEDLFRAYQGLALLGAKDEAIKELERLFEVHGAKFEEIAKKEYAERLKAAKGEAPKEADGAKKGEAINLQFHPTAAATDLKIELTTAAKATRPHKAIYLTVKVTNRSPDEILTGIAREWGDGKGPAKVPGTLLYASIAPAKDTTAPALEPAYQAGDASHDSIVDPVIIAAGKSAEILLRMDWPGTGFVPARQFPDAGGSYKVQALLVFQKTGKSPQKLQYVMSEPTTVEVPGLKPARAKPEPWTGDPVIEGDELTGRKKLSTFKRLPKAADATLLRINCYKFPPTPDLTAANFPMVLDSIKAIKTDDPKYKDISLAPWSYAQFDTPEGRFQVEFNLGGLAVLTAPDGSVGRVTFAMPKE